MNFWSWKSYKTIVVQICSEISYFQYFGQNYSQLAIVRNLKKIRPTIAISQFARREFLGVQIQTYAT